MCRINLYTLAALLGWRLLIFTLCFQGFVPAADAQSALPPEVQSQLSKALADPYASRKKTEKIQLAAITGLLEQARSGDLATLKQRLDQTIAQEPSDEAFLLRGLIDDFEGNHFLAQTNYFKGLQENQRNLLIRNFLALSYYLAGRKEGALRTLERTLTLSAAPLREAHNLAFLQLCAGQAAAAHQTLAPHITDYQAINQLLARFRSIEGIRDKRNKVFALVQLQLEL